MDKRNRIIFIHTYTFTHRHILDKYAHDVFFSSSQNHTLNYLNGKNKKKWLFERYVTKNADTKRELAKIV